MAALTPTLNGLKIIGTNLNFILVREGLFVENPRFLPGGKKLYNITAQFGNPEDNKIWKTGVEAINPLAVMQYIYIYSEVYNFSELTKEQFRRTISILEIAASPIYMHLHKEADGSYSAHLAEYTGGRNIEIPNATHPNQGSRVILTAATCQELIDTLINAKNYQEELKQPN